MKKLILIFLCATFSPWGYAQMAPLNVEQAVRFLADKVITTTPLEVHNHQTGISYKPGDNIPVDPYVRVRTKLSDWHYENGVMNLAMFMAGDVLQDKKYSQYTIDTYEFIFRHLPYFEKQFRDPNIPRPSFRQFFDFQYLDYCGTMGAALSETYARTGRNSAKYLETLNRVAEYILYKEFRLDDGTWCREYPRKGAVWADDLYMGTIFLSRMGKLTGDTLYFNEAARQVVSFSKYLMDPYKKIYHHAYFDDAGITNGAHWGRANGWVMMAQVELLDVLPEDHLMRPELLRILNQFVGGIARLQGQTGMWHQLLDRYDSYLESSCTAMFVYSIAKSVNNEWVDSSFAQVAWRGWQGLYGKITEDAQVTDICVGTHIEMNLPFYYNRPRSVNDTHGLASTILAGTEMIILQKSIGPRVNPRSF